MKLVVVNGSPHGREGGTARVAAPLLEACREEGVTIETFYLVDLGIAHCEGCGACMSTGVCPIDDGLPAVHAALGEADLVVLASPTYVFQVTGLMKTFLDRTAALFHRPPLLGKHGAVVTSSAGLGESDVIRYLGACLELLGAACVGAVWGTYRPPGRLWEPEAAAERAARLGRELVAASREGRTYALSDQIVAKRRFLRELIDQNRRIFRKDHAWWTEQGWFDGLPGTRKPRGETR